MDGLLGQTLRAEELRQVQAVALPELLRRPVRRRGGAKRGQELAVGLIHHLGQAKPPLVRREREWPVGSFARPYHEPLTPEVIDRGTGWEEWVELETKALDVLEGDVVVVGDARGAGLAAEVLREVAQRLDAASCTTLRFEHHHVVTCLGEPIRGAQTREPRSHHDDLLDADRCGTGGRSPSR